METNRIKDDAGKVNFTLSNGIAIDPSTAEFSKGGKGFFVYVNAATAPSTDSLVVELLGADPGQSVTLKVTAFQLLPIAVKKVLDTSTVTDAIALW